MSAFQQLEKCRAALRLMAVELSRVQDRERLRIASGLHDDLGQTLAAMQIHLGRLAALDLDEQSREIVAELSTQLTQAVTSTRTLTFELTSPRAPELGIEAELEQLATRLSNVGTLCEADLTADSKPLDAEVAGAVVRAVRELAYNIHKHANADSARIMAQRIDDDIQITISDNGVGFDLNTRANPEELGTGLLIVQERMAEVGGHVKIDSSVGSGTTIVLTAPLLERPAVK